MNSELPCRMQTEIGRSVELGEWRDQASFTLKSHSKVHNSTSLPSNVHVQCCAIGINFRGWSFSKCHEQRRLDWAKSHNRRLEVQDILTLKVEVNLYPCVAWFAQLSVPVNFRITCTKACSNNRTVWTWHELFNRARCIYKLQSAETHGKRDALCINIIAYILQQTHTWQHEHTCYTVLF